MENFWAKNSSIKQLGGHLLLMEAALIIFYLVFYSLGGQVPSTYLFSAKISRPMLDILGLPVMATFLWATHQIITEKHHGQRFIMRIDKISEYLEDEKKILKHIIVFSLIFALLSSLIISVTQGLLTGVILGCGGGLSIGLLSIVRLKLEKWQIET